MKSEFSRIIAAILLICLGSGCVPGAHQAEDPDRVEVLAPISRSDGSYSLDFFELLGLEDLEILKGSFVEFFISPRIEDGKLHGSHPRTRFLRTTEGRYVPANEVTQQLATVYLHMQRLAALDVELGAADVNKWPRDVGVAVRVKGGMNNNAFYDGLSDSLLFVSYVQQGLPISINAGVLAHEHFHSLFYKLSIPDKTFQGTIHNREEFLKMTKISEIGIGKVTKLPVKDPETQRALYDITLLRAMNEGFADYWGWMYTGNPDFLAQSLPREGRPRSLKVDKNESWFSLPSQKEIERGLSVMYGNYEKKEVKDYAIGYAYQLATRFSRMLKRFADIYAETRDVDSLKARKEIGKILLKTLPKIKEDFKMGSGSVYTSVQFLQTMTDQIEDMQQEECEFLVSVVNRSINQDEESSSFVCYQHKTRWKIQKTLMASSLGSIKE